MQVSTVGHSTLPIEKFIGLLERHGIKQLMDVRKIPRSRHNPQFNRENLANALGRRGILYRHMPGLGGLRRPRRDSINTGWRNPSFRGYADYMQTEEFAASLAELIAESETVSTAVMCAEAVPWRCHRSLIADALTVRGIPVVELEHNGRVRPHVLTPFARVTGTTVTYPGDTRDLFADAQGDV